MSVSLFPLPKALTLLGQILSALINADKEDHNNASVILSFCKHCGEDYAGNSIKQKSCYLFIFLRLLLSDICYLVSFFQA